MARVFSFSLNSTSSLDSHSYSNISFSHKTNLISSSSSLLNPILLGSRFGGLDLSGSRRLERVWAASSPLQQIGYSTVKRPPLVKKNIKEKELELNVSIRIEEEFPHDPELLSIVEKLRMDVPKAMKLAYDGLKDAQNRPRDGFESVELSVLLCDDEFIRKLNKEWRDEDNATGVLSMSQHMPAGLKLPILMLGHIVISVETATRQAMERGHNIQDEIRILMVRGLLNLLGFDIEISEAKTKMEELLLKSLGWKGKGLIHSAYKAESNGSLHTESPIDRKKKRSLRSYKPKFSYIFCDMDGTLLNSKSQITQITAKALREATSRGVKVVIATGKARPAAISLLGTVDLAGKDGIVSEFSPGVFVQGLLVYGKQGRKVFRRNMDLDVCREACLYSLEHKIPLIAYCGDRCLTLFDHPHVDSIHTVYHEPKAEVMPTVEHLLAETDIQKVILMDTVEGVASAIRPYWSEATRDGRATIVQALPDMLEIVPPGTSKGSGVTMLLDHLGISSEEVMAIGDGDNDVEMLELASLGIALRNGTERAKAVANVIGASNDEDGVADAIYRFAL